MSRFRSRDRIASLVLCLLAALVFIALYFISGAGRRTSDGIGQDGAPGERDEATPEERRRNLLWGIFNSDCEPGVRPDAFELALCRTLHPATGDEVRLQSLLQLQAMGAVRFDHDDAGRLVGILRDGSADTKIGLMRGMAADSEFGMRIADLTCDYDRMRLFLWGEEVPLE